MQIEIYTPTQTQPLPPVEWNYAAVKAWIEDGLEAYKGRVYTEDSVAQAKKDRATLNKLAAAIDGKRKEMKALYLEPFSKFEAEAKELTEMVKAQVNEIDAQVKNYDDFRRQEKRKEIETAYATMIGDLAELVPYERLHDPKWLNVTARMVSVTTELAGKIERIASGLKSIDSLNLAPDIAEQVKGAFLKDFDLAAALAERERIERQREELARYKAAQEAVKSTPAVEDTYTRQAAEIPAAVQETRPIADPEVHTETAKKVHTIELDFRVWVTNAQMIALREFLQTNGIKYGRVPRE